MKHLMARQSVILALLVNVVFFSSCHKRVAMAPAAPTPSPTPIAPTVRLQASPETITQGGRSTLTWSSSNASQVQLYPEIGDVPMQGERSVSPNQSTVYTATATGVGGTATATVAVTVSVRSAATATPPLTAEELFREKVSDVYFNYDKAELRSEARDVLTHDAEFFRAHSEIRFTIEGHCDERGGEEYNLGLGARRAASAKEFLVSLGLPADQIQTISFGKERPFCTEENESCYQQNRRDHFVMAAQ
jgi:peptidoglycan-associated lipoprotein